MAIDGTLNTKQHRAIRALLTEKTTADAAKKAGVGERTLWRWMNENEPFKMALSEAETLALGESVRRLVALQFKALQAIEEALDDEGANHAVKLRAAALVMDTSLRLREQHTLEERLAEMEKRYNEINVKEAA